MQDRKTYRPLPPARELVHNAVHQGSKSHLLSLEDGHASSQEKDDVTALYLGCREKAGAIR